MRTTAWGALLVLSGIALVVGRVIRRAEADVTWSHPEIVTWWRTQAGDSLRIVLGWQAAQITDPRQAPISGYDTRIVNDSTSEVLALGSTLAGQLRDTLTIVTPPMADTLFVAGRIRTVDARNDHSGWLPTRQLIVPGVALGPNPPSAPEIDSLMTDTTTVGFVVVEVDSLRWGQRQYDLGEGDILVMQTGYWADDMLLACHEWVFVAAMAVSVPFFEEQRGCPPDVPLLAADTVTFANGDRVSIGQLRGPTSTLARVEKVGDGPTQPPTGDPGAILDMTVMGAENGLLVRFSSRPNAARYECRYAPAPWPGWGGLDQSAVVIDAVPEGEMASVFISGLPAGVAHGVACVSYYGTLNVDARFGPITSVLSGTPQ